MSTKKVILSGITLLLILEILFVATIALIFPVMRSAQIRLENFDEKTLENTNKAANPSDLSNWENLVKLQQIFQAQKNFQMEKESQVKASAAGGETNQSVKDTKKRKDIKVEYQSIQHKEKGVGMVDTFAPNDSATYVAFEMANNTAEVYKSKKIQDAKIEWNQQSNFYDKNGYILSYGNWADYITDYFFAEKTDIVNPDEKSVAYDATTKLYSLKIVVNASAAEHYKNKIITLGKGSIQNVVFQDACASITFTFDKNWKILNYQLQEEYQTITKVVFEIKSKTTATHHAKFSY